MLLVTREQWGARKPKQRTPFHPTRPTTGHWNGPKLTVRGNSQWDHAFCAALVRGIQNYHMDTMGWSDGAYNWVGCPHKYIFEMRGLKYQNGANGTNLGNKTSPALMYLGGEGNPFTEDAKAAFHEATKYISDHSSAEPGAIGHRDHKNTACPGDEIYNWIKLGMPVKYVSMTEEDDVMNFESHEARVKFVKNSYRKIAERTEDPSQGEVDFWVYMIALNPIHALDLIVDLHGERSS